MPVQQKPSIGRIVHYMMNRGTEPDIPLAAIVTYAADYMADQTEAGKHYRCNLAIFDTTGELRPHPPCGVRFLSEGDKAPPPGTHYCCYPPRVN